MKRSRFVWMFTITAVLAVSVIVTAQMASDSWKDAAALPKVKNGKSVQIRMQSDNRRELSIKYRVPDPVISEFTERSGEKFTKIQLGNAPLRGKQGEPVLPVIPFQFIIPYGCEIASIEILNENKTSQTITSPMEYGNTPIALMKGAKAVKATPKAAIYENTKGFPEKNSELVSVQNKRGVKIGIVNLHPVTYYPKSNIIEICREFEINVTFRDSKKNSLKPLRMRSTKQDLQKLGVENPDMLKQYQDSSAKKAIELPLNGKLIDASESYQYVVITNEAMRDASTDVSVNDLISYRQANGITAKLVTIESILEDYTGKDDAEKVRNFIIDAYTNWETEYVVLGGDVNIIPIRNLYAAEDGGTQIQSDFYYQCLDGSFNSDADNYWGEPTDGEDGGDIDLFAEVKVGRISAETPEEMSNAVYKILAYEKDDESEEYLRTSCMVGEELGSNFGDGEFGFAHPFMNEIKNGSSASGYTTAGFRSNAAFTVDSLDDFDSTWEGPDLISLINSNRYSILNHLGHANTNYVMKLYADEADKNIKNTKFMFVFSQGCFPGDLNNDCIAEHLTTSGRSGLFAGVFNSNYGWGAYNDSYETLDGPSQRIDRQFWDAYFNEYIYNLGAINADGHEDNVWDINGDLIRWCIYETNLFGDPFTVIRGQVKGPKVVMKSSSVNDANGGNNDKIINPGEQIEINLSFQNVGNEIASDVRATISSSDPLISVVNSNLTFGSISCCGAIKSSDNFAKIAVSHDCQTPYTFPLTVNITDNSGNSWEQTLTLVVHTTYTISGTVTTITGSNPVPGAIVKFNGPLSGQAVANANGEYTIACIDGDYSLHAEAAAYQATDSVSVTLPPNAANVNFKMGRSEMLIDPVSINKTLQINDSATIPLHITNTGDLDLVVTADTKNISTVPGKKTGTIHRVNSDTSRYSHIADSRKLKKLMPQKKYKGNKLSSENKLNVLYLNTMLPDNVPDYFAQSISELENVEKLDLFFCYEDIPDLEYLMQYDAVIVSSEYPWADNVTTGNILADYVDAGGSVCMLVASFANSGDYGLKGRIITQDYLPLQTGYPGSYSGEPTFITHAITSDVKFLETEIPVEASGLQGDAVLLGTYSNGVIAAAYNRTKPVVAINVFPMDYYWGGDLITMMDNTIEWFAQSKWLSLSPANTPLTIAPGSGTDISVKLRSASLPGGTYNGLIKLKHNDPQQNNPLQIPVVLDIDGFRSLTVTPQSVDFGTLWLGLKDTIDLTFTNNGTQKTTVNSIMSNNSQYSAVTALPLSIMSGKSVKVGIVYNPLTIESSDATFTISSDAEDNPSIRVSVSGNCTAGPKAKIEPSSMTFNFTPSDNAAEETATLSNTGADVLSYHTQIRLKSKPSYTGVSKNAARVNRINERLIYSQHNYKNQFALDRVIVALNDGESAIANQALLNSISNGNVRELALAKIPGKGIRAYNGKKLIVIPLINNTREGVLDAIKQLRHDVNVAYAEPDYKVKAIGIPNDPLFENQYALNNIGQTGGKTDSDIDAPEGWDTFDGAESNIILAIIDTGIDYMHPDLAGNIWTNAGEIPDNGIDDDNNGFVDDVHGYDFAYKDSDPMDVYGHGTHCSGIAAARGNDGIGVCGVSYGAKLMAAKFLDDNGSGNTSDAIDAIAYAYAMGATISSNSWGGGGYEQSLYDIIAASGLFIAAAGNSGENTDNYENYPSCYDLDNIISVAATDHNDELAYFSNYGTSTVDLGAPGVDILSCLPNNNHEAWSGTSMATPHVSGCAVLLKTYNPDLTSTEIKNAILSGADTISSLQGKTLSGGRLNIRKTLEAVSPPWLSVTPSANGQIETGSTRQFTITADPHGLTAGTWVAEVVFKTDDPFQNDHIITVTANISPCRTLRSSIDTLQFGTVWVSRDSTNSFILINDCNSPVTVNSFEFSNTHFASDQTLPFSVPPFGTFRLPVKYTPDKSGISNGNIVLYSDAEDNPHLTIPVHGKAQTPPCINVNPLTISKTLAFNKQKNAKITMTNTGEADFEYSIKTVKPPKSSAEKKLALSDATVYVSQDFGTIRKLDISSGEFVGDSIQMDGSDFDGLAFDREYIYYSNYTSDVIRINPENGQITDTITCQATSGIDGLAVTDDYIILGSYSDQIIYICDKLTGKLVNQWSCPGFVGGLAYCSKNESVFTYNYQYSLLEEHALSDGSLINSADYTMDWTAGLGYSESAEVLIASTYSGGVFLIDPQTLQIISKFDIYNVFAIAADEAGANNKWLTSDTKSGVLHGGSTVSFNALFNSSDIEAGSYSANLQIKQTLPLPPGPYSISCNMTVLEEKHCQASPSVLSFNQTWIGRTDTLRLYLVNSGNAATSVKSIVSNNELFNVLNNAPFSIPAFDSVPVYVCYTPKKTKTEKGTLTITSDAVKSGSVKVTLQGSALNPPKISYSPDFISRTLLPGKTQQAIINLKNKGGADYEYNVSIVPVNDGNNGAASLFGYSYNGLFKLDPATGAILSSISSDDFEAPSTFDGNLFYSYSYKDMNIRVVDPSNGETIRMIPLQLSDKDFWISSLASTGSYLMINFYSYIDNSYKVTVIDKESGSVRYEWIYSDYYTGFCGGKKANTFMTFNEISNKLETRSIQDNSLVSSIDIPVHYSYLTYSHNLDCIYTSDGYMHVMINASTGKTINSFSTDYYMRLAADENTGMSWLGSASESGVVPSKGVSNVSLTFNSENMLPGTYQANVVISHVSGWQPGPFIIPCELTVLPLSKLTVTPGTLDFGKVWKGSDSLSALTLENSGNLEITVFSVTNLNRAFTTEQLPVTIQPFSKRTLGTHFRPANTGSFSNTAIILSNAIDLPVKLVTMKGTGINPPSITVKPEQFSVELSSGSKLTQTLSLENSGDAPYGFNIRAIDNLQKPSNGSVFVSYFDSIYELDPQTLKPVNAFVPMKDHSFSGLAYDGTYIYMLEDSFPFKIIVFDPVNVSIVDTLVTDIHSVMQKGNCLSVTSEYILLYEQSHSKLYFIDKKSGKTVKTMTIENCYNALTVAEDRGSIFYYNYLSSNIEEISMENGDPINSFPIPDSTIYAEYMGYSSSNNALFITDYGSKIITINADNGSLISNKDSPVYFYGDIATDEVFTGSNWIKLSSGAGVVPAHGKLDLETVFDATKTDAGNFEGQIIITPDVACAPGPFTIPCNMTVNEGEIAKK